MKRKDWLSWGASLVLHALLFLGFLMVQSDPEPMPAGFIEVDFGPISTGRPVERTPPQQVVEDEQEPQEEVLAQEQTQVEEEEEGRPVDLPDQPEPVPDPETVQSPDTEEIGVEDPLTEERDRETQEARIAQEARSGGDPDGTSGATSGDDGPGAEEEKTAPYQLEGLENRILLRELLPNYAEKVNATIQMQIIVDPQGNVRGVTPRRKGNPRLEEAVTQALRRWRFNPLQPNVPQENQIGIVTFHFRLQ